MATQIYNKATLNYNSGSDLLTTSSNTASVTMNGPLEAAKHTLETAYRIGDEITYNLFVTNTSSNQLTNLSIQDDLGTYKLTTVTPNINVTPLTYVDPAKLFVNGVSVSTISGTVSADKDKVTFSLASLAANSTALIQYKAIINEYATATVEESSIKNTVTVSAQYITDSATAFNSLDVDEYALVTIDKDMSPNPVVDGGTLIYTFHIRNYGNIDATNVILRDDFAKLPSISSVYVGGDQVEAEDYSYVNGQFQYPSDESEVTYTINKATIAQDTTTGVVTVTPTESIVTITATI